MVSTLCHQDDYEKAGSEGRKIPKGSAGASDFRMDFGFIEVARLVKPFCPRKI